MTIDFDKEYHCPHCGEAMQVWMPILVTPGAEEVDVSDICYESNNPSDSQHWYCPGCDEGGFLPVELDE